MSRYLEFTRTSSSHLIFSLGNPVHTGNRPSPFRSLLGLRIDKRLVAFEDPELVERLYATLIAGRQLKKRHIQFDCVAFVALMHNLELQTPEHNPLEETRRLQPTDDPNDDAPLNLGIVTQLGTTQYRHSITPAPTDTEALYLHKLGDDGPICLSGLRDAMRMFRCTVADEVILNS